MTAKGKITAANLFQSLTHPNGQGPVRVLLTREDAETLKAAGVNREPGLVPATRKTNVETLAVLEAETRLERSSGFSGRGQRDYRFRTSQGWTLWLSPAQTLILAPEDAPAIKRAHAEARLEEVRRNVEAQYRAMSTEKLMKAHRDAQEDGATDTMALVETIVEERNREVKVPTPGAPKGRDAQLDVYAGVPHLVAPPGTPEPETLEEGALHRAARLIREGHALAAQAPEYRVPDDVKAQDVALVAKDRAARIPVQARPRAVPGDVVRIHRGPALYEVLRVEEEHLVGGEDISQARLVPCDPEDGRGPFWTSVDLLHVVPPVARLRTQEADPAAPRVRYCTDALAVEGPGWSVERGKLRWVALIQTSAVRASTAHLAVFNGPSWHGARPVATLRIGDAVVVDGRCFQVAWDGGPGEPRLVPAMWRNRVAES